ARRCHPEPPGRSPHARRHPERGLRALRTAAERSVLTPAEPARRPASSGRDVPLPPLAERVVPASRRALPARSLDGDPRRRRGRASPEARSSLPAHPRAARGLDPPPTDSMIDAHLPSGQLGSDPLGILRSEWRSPPCPQALL